MTAWSYSSISTFKQCPKKYYNLKVAKDVKDIGSEAMLYGNQVHKAAEDFIKEGTPIPKKFDYMNCSHSKKKTQQELGAAAYNFRISPNTLNLGVKIG